MRLLGVLLAGLALVAVFSTSLSGPSAFVNTEAEFRRALQARTGIIRLKPGVLEISSELVIPAGARDLEIQGWRSGTLLRATRDFRGRALISCALGSRIKLAHFTVDGNRFALERAVGLPPSHFPFARFYVNNGILAENVEALTISNVRFLNVANFPILVNRSSNVLIERVHIENSGSMNTLGRNNTTGGILLEEGTAGFEVRNCTLKNVRGNGIWTHSLYTSPRNQDGKIAGNHFDGVGRDAIQVGHATNVRVERNTGTHIGYPAAEVDFEARATPVALDTAGNTDRSVYLENRFEEINGKCMDLDGFHHGEVRGNSCINRRPADAYPHGHYGIVMNNSNPDMQSERIIVADNEIDGALFGGIFVIGNDHTIVRNRLRNLNLAHCNETAAKYGCLFLAGEPDILRSGIYLGRRAERPAVTRNNVIQDNEISGYKIRGTCILAAPSVPFRENTIERNRCSDEWSSRP